MAEAPLSPTEFAASFRAFMVQMAEAARRQPGDEPYFRGRLRAHFGVDPTRHAIVGESFGLHDHPNIHVAVHTRWSASASRGIWQSIGLSESSDRPQVHGNTFARCPRDFREIVLGRDRATACTPSEQARRLEREISGAAVGPATLSATRRAYAR